MKNGSQCVSDRTPHLMRLFQILSFFFICLLLTDIHAESNDNINIATIFSLTGNAAIANRSSVLGTRLAVNEINEDGGVLGRSINLIQLDNMSTPIGSSIAAEQAVNAGVVAIIGAQWSSHSLPIARVAQQHKIPMISNFSTHPKLTSIGEYIFRVCYTDNFQGEVMADFAWRDLKAKTATVFVDLTSDYSLELSRIFRVHFTSLGGTIIGEIEYKAKKHKKADLIQRAKAKSADVLFLTGHEESGAIASELKRQGIKGVLLGGDGWSDKAFWKMGGHRLKQGYFCTHWSEFTEREEVQKFVGKYKDRENFGTGAALAYDAVMVLKKAIEFAGTTDGARLSEALSTMGTHEGVTGSINLGSTGDPVKSAVIMEIQNGEPRYHKIFAPK